MVATSSQDSQASGTQNGAPRAASPGLLAQISRFVLIGGFCALVDFGLYWLLLQAGLWVHLAKALSFVAGTTTAYFLNRRFTFTAAQKGGAGQLGGFMLLYTVTFFVNVGTNALALHLLPDLRWQVAIAWIVAQGTATTINFIMLKWVVFREPRA
ncbi:GtrA family protein [Saccharomonospora xinjiangensis]|uniref:Putative membrane protein n=1 Tax=Saccharomonospora xinjiangensis XJ-54 TaxID=882086 RepID=I0V1Z0_9PSEU|nr:GtrA family protein [Saccharomonospora xinjiangensis]EID54143.1 putative membrane protein [Saccharomonospora xinjiangensis XJ-54]